MAAAHILCVDDQAPIRLVLSTFLETKGYRVRTATHGLDALRAVAEEMPDLIITDVNMPSINGFELTRRLRTNHRTSRIPIIILSERAEANDVLVGYSEGADEYVPKPVELAVLAAKVDALLRRTRDLAEPRALRGKVVLALRGKGGVGATSLAVNTAVALTGELPSRVALLDLDLEFGNVGVLLDIQPQRTLAQLAGVPVAELDDEGFAPLVAAHSSGVQVLIGAASPEEAELVSISSVQQTIERLRSQVDFILVDAPRSFSEVNLAALDAAEILWLVSTPHVAALKAAADCLRVLEQLQVPLAGLVHVLNRTTPHGLETDQVTAFLGRKPDVVVPYTPQFDAAADVGRPLVTAYPGESAASAIRDLAARVSTAR